MIKILSQEVNDHVARRWGSYWTLATLVLVPLIIIFGLVAWLYIVGLWVGLFLGQRLKND